jgi:excinuclease ABC subunit C
MVAKICDIDIITCQTEVEALVLETNLIKHLTPKYNILMKDDKNLAYIKITGSPVPELIKTRQKIRDGGIYFGPYVSAVEQSVRALRRIFKIRNCRMKFSRTPFVKGDKGDFVSGKNPQALRASSFAKELPIQITDKA